MSRPPAFPRILIALAALATAFSPSRAEEPAASQSAAPTAPAASAEMSVNVVEIPVLVRKGKQPVRGLTAADFEVLERDRALPIVGFEAVDLGDGKGTPPRSPAARRHILMLFDLAFTRPHEALRGVVGARAALSALHPSDLVGVALFTARGDFPMLLRFTADHDAAARTLASLEAAMRGDEPPSAEGADGKAAGVDPLKLQGVAPGDLRVQTQLMTARSHPEEAWDDLILTGGLGGAIQAELFMSMIDATGPETHGARISQAGLLAGRFDQLSQALQGIEGRKLLYLFSSGFEIGAVDTRRPGSQVMVGPFDTALLELRRTGWTLYPVVVDGPRLSGLEDDTFAMFAERTGGAVLGGDNDFARLVDQSLDAGAVSYLLAVDVGELAHDGRFHEVTVRAPGAPRGAKLDHRTGYYAPSSEREQTPARRAAEAAQLLATGTLRDDLGVSAAILPGRAVEAGAQRLPVLVEVPGAALLDESAPHQEVDIFGYAFDAAGGARDLFATVVALDRGRLGDRLVDGGIRYLGELDLPPGEYQLRLLVRSRPSGRTSLLALPLPVATDAAATPSADRPYFVSSSEDAWIVARQTGAGFHLQGHSLVPALAGSLPAGGATPVVILGRQLATAGGAVSARVLTAEGAAAAQGSLELVSVTPGGAGEPDLLLATLHAGELPPGDYLLELRRQGHDATVVSRGPFQVVVRPATGEARQQ